MTTVTDHPFISLVIEALNLTHPRFALRPRPGIHIRRSEEPAGRRKVRERPFLMEFYHEFRRLWDRAVPGAARARARRHPGRSGRRFANARPALLATRRERPARSTSRRGLDGIPSNPDAVAADQTLLCAVRQIAWLSRDGERGDWRSERIAVRAWESDT